MANIFSPVTLVAELSKAAAQRLLYWRTYLGQFDYQIVHIPGSENCWGDLLSRWRKLGTGSDGEVSGSVVPRFVHVRAMAVYACLDADYRLPSKSAIKHKQ